MRFLAALIPMLMNALVTLIGKIIAALGITAVTYVGLEALITQFKNEITNTITGVPLGLLQLFYLSGGGVVLNIFFGCLTFVISFKALTKLVPRMKKG